MSSTLYWKPVKEYSGYLDDQLKFILREKHGYGFEITLDQEDIPYLSGLADGGVKDAKKLIGLINKHGRVQLEERN